LAIEQAVVAGLDPTTHAMTDRRSGADGQPGAGRARIARLLEWMAG
jgi:hypothetical protein